jgi:hypothetical protein
LQFTFSLIDHYSMHSYFHLNSLEYFKPLNDSQEFHFICILPSNFEPNQLLRKRFSKLYLNLALFHIKKLKNLKQDPNVHNYMASILFLSYYYIYYKHLMLLIWSNLSFFIPLINFDQPPQQNQHFKILSLLLLFHKHIYNNLQLFCKKMRVLQ